MKNNYLNPKRLKFKKIETKFNFDIVRLMDFTTYIYFIWSLLTLKSRMLTSTFLILLNTMVNVPKILFMEQQFFA